jgi:hypothetical protein
MSPIRISPERQVYISTKQELLGQAPPTTESMVVREEVYVLPLGKKLDYLVLVKGFPDVNGGIVETERLTSGHEPDNITLTTPDDPDLSRELGVTSVKIDGVIYEATEIEEDK